MTTDVLLRLVQEWDAVLDVGRKNPTDLDTAEELRLRLEILKLGRRLNAPRVRAPGYIYLACPYSHARPDVMVYRTGMVTQIAAALMSHRIQVYSPLTHGHQLAEANPYLGDGVFHHIWLEHAEIFVSNARVLGVVQLHGWDTSPGVAHEIQVATHLHLPVIHIDPQKGIERHLPKLEELL